MKKFNKRFDKALALSIIKQTKENGGYTAPSEKGRYIVALPQYENKQKSTRIKASHVMTYLKLAKKLGYALGTWEEKGCIYLDIVKSFDDFTQAYKFAKLGKQIGFYDMVNKETIRL